MPTSETKTLNKAQNRAVVHSFYLCFYNHNSSSEMINEQKPCHNSKYFLVLPDDLYLMRTDKTWIFYDLRRSFRPISQIGFRFDVICDALE